MVDRRPTRRSIVASMGLEPRYEPEDPISPPTWAPTPASPTSHRRSRSRMDSNASRGTAQTATRAASRQSKIIPAAAAVPDEDESVPRSTKAAGSASKRYKPPRPVAEPAAPPADTNGSASGGGTVGRASLTSRLFGRGGASATPEPTPTSTAAQKPASDSTSYDGRNNGDGDQINRSSTLLGFMNRKDRSEPTPATDGDGRMTRWNARNKKQSMSVISSGMTDLGLYDDDETEIAARPRSGREQEDDADTIAPKPLGIGRMSSKQSRERRTSAPASGAALIAANSTESPSLPMMSKHQLRDDGPQPVAVQRKGSKASRNDSTKRRKNGVPQLPPLLGIGTGGGLGSMMEASHEVQPDYELEGASDSELEGVAFPRHQTTRIDEEDEDEEFQEADDSAFPITPGVVEPRAFDPPETAEPADVYDQDTVAPVLLDNKASAATIGEHVPTGEVESEDEEAVPAYDEATAREVPLEKSGSPGKKASRGGAGPALAAGAGIGAAGLAGAGLFASEKRREERAADADAVTADALRPRPRSSGKSPRIPGGFADPAVDYTDDEPESLLEPEVEDERMSPVPASKTRREAAVAPVPLMAKSSKKVKRKEPKETSRDAERGLVAAPPLQRTMSPPAPEKPKKSAARKLAGSKDRAAGVPVTETRAERESPREKDYSSRKKKAAAAAAVGGGALAIGGATAAARHEDEYDDEPAILSDEDDEADYDRYMYDDDDDEDDDHAYDRPREQATARRPKSKPKSSKRRQALAAAPVKPTKRSKAVKALTPVQRHYLLKALVCLQMQMEWEELEKLGALTQYGYPFTPDRPKLTRVKAEFKNEYTTGDDIEEQADDPYANDGDEARRVENLQEPLILRHLFHTHLMTFPGLGEAPLKFWQKRIQVFFDEMAARNFSTSVERAEYSKRRFYTLAATRYLGGYFARGVGVRGSGELRGPGPGEKGSEKWGVGKQWGKGTVKRGLDRPARIDSALWKKINALFGDGAEGRVWQRAGKETTRVRGDWQAWKEQIIENETGLEETIDFLDISKIRNLPPKYRNAEEWARNHAAYLLHSLFVATPNADSTYKVLRGIHTLFPYWGAKQLLKYANAQVLIEGILNLLLARPAGAKSLIQRIASYVIGSEATTLQKEYINPLKKAIGDAELTGRIDEYVSRGSRPEGRSVRAKAEKTGDDVLTVILLSSGGTPLRREAQDHVVDLQHSFARSPLRGSPDMAYPADSTFAKENADKVHIPKWDGSRQEEEEALKFARLKLYLRDSLKKRDREQAVKVASGALVPTIVKDFLQTVMYDVIKQVASTADLSARLGDLQNFIEDLLEVKKKKDDSIEAWVALAARHENSLYYFVHECIGIAGPFFEWTQIGLDYMALSTTDPVHPADRSAKNIEVNLEELLRDSRLSEKDVELILEEVDELAVYTKWSKVAYELEMRKNFLLSRPDAATNSPLTAADIPSAAMKEDIQDIDSLMRELMEAEGVPVDDGTLPNESRGTEARELALFWFDVMDPLGQHLKAEKGGGGAAELVYQPQRVTPPVPCLKYMRKALPVFREALRDRLPDWQHGDANGARGGASGKVTKKSAAAAAAASGNSGSNKKASSSAAGGNNGNGKGSFLFGR